MSELFAAGALSGKRVLITGGGSGLGRAVARRSAALGASVFICGRRADILTRTADEIQEEYGASVVSISCDVREEGAVAEMMESIWSVGPLDALVNNAGGAILSRAETLSVRAFDAVHRVVVNGTLNCTLEAARRWMAADRGGTVISTVASGVESGQPFTAPLTVATGAVMTLMRSLALEWGPRGIRCNAIAPGRFPTSGVSGSLGKGREANPLKGVPLRRYGSEHEFADLCVFLMSDAASFITGEMVTIDGGAALMGQSTSDLFDWDDEQWGRLRAKR